MQVSFRNSVEPGRKQGYPQRLDLLVQYEHRERQEAERAAAILDEDNPASTEDPDGQETSLVTDGQSASPQEDPDAWLEQEPIVNSGYVFHYTLVDPGGPGQPGNFEITASPLQYGKTGTQSFFIDGTCILRSTSENRAARRDDSTFAWDESSLSVE